MKEPVESLTAHVADFVVNAGDADIPSAVADLVKKSILDTLAVALSGSVAEMQHLDPALSFGPWPAGRVRQPSSDPNLRLAPRFAALANGTAMHADDFDDTWQATPDRYQGVHPTAPVLAAVLAAGRAGRSRSGRDVTDRLPGGS